MFAHLGVNPWQFELTHWDNDTYLEPVLGNYLKFDNSSGNVKLDLILSEGEETAVFNKTP